MTLRALKEILARHPATFPRFVLPHGDYIPGHAHVTEVGHMVKNYVDCGGETGRDEKVLLQTHVGRDIEHRLRSDRFEKILQLGQQVLPSDQLEVEVEYDCCVVAQYPLSDVQPAGQYLDLILRPGRTRCRASERENANEACCATTATCC